MFEPIGRGFTLPLSGQGDKVASATTTDIWGGGDSLHITGTTTITSFGTAPYAGVSKRIIFDGAVLLTHSANLNLPGSVNLTTAAGDSCVVYADTTTQLDILSYTRATGRSLTTNLITGSAEQSNSGANMDFTIPTGIKKITLTLNFLSAAAAGGNILVRLGDSGGIGTSDYRPSDVDGTAFVIAVVPAGSKHIDGIVTFTTTDAGISWIGSGTVGQDESTVVNNFYGRKSVGTELTTLRIVGTGVSGGSARVLYE